MEGKGEGAISGGAAPGPARSSFALALPQLPPLAGIKNLKHVECDEDTHTNIVISRPAVSELQNRGEYKITFIAGRELYRPVSQKSE